MRFTGGDTPSTDTSRRFRLGLSTVGIATLTSSLVLAVVSSSHARALATADPEVTGFLDASLQYRRLRAATVHLAWTGALSLGAALVLQHTRSRLARWALRLGGALLAVSGAVLVIRPPQRLGQTTLTHAHRAIGATLLGLGAPLVGLSWGAS